MLAEQYEMSALKQRLVAEFDSDEPAQLYDGTCCQRGQAENRVKEAQLDLFGTRGSREVRRQPAATAAGGDSPHADGSLV